MSINFADFFEKISGLVLNIDIPFSNGDPKTDQSDQKCNTETYNKANNAIELHRVRKHFRACQPEYEPDQKRGRLAKGVHPARITSSVATKKSISVGLGNCKTANRNCHDRIADHVPGVKQFFKL